MDSIGGILVIALSLGLIANLHCIGMCGPISLALPLNRKNAFTAILGILIYTFGRSMGYASLGLIIGFIGLSADLIGALQWLSIISGILIILFAWKSYYNQAPQLGKLNAFISKSMGKIFKAKSDKGKNKRLLSFGIINAFLPCGMVYVALLSAMNTGSISNSALFMIFFGLGTAPGFIVLALLKDKIFRWNFLSKKIVVASLVSLVGLAILLRGMNLGIPYISPKMELATNANNTKSDEEIIVSCCSKSKKETTCKK